jgi:threonylcarbamoyladenosine tRNA methylthiotransferase MtaB
MRRRYDTGFFMQKVNSVKSFMPDAFIGVDVMVGCRGETDEYFENAYNFINSLDVDHLHVFTYSERPGTKALEIPYVVPSEVRHERCRRLLSLSDEKTLNFYKRYLGRTMDVLLEHAPKGKPMHGFTDNYIKVEVPNTPELDNTIVKARLERLTPDNSAVVATVC